MIPVFKYLLPVCLLLSFGGKAQIPAAGVVSVVAFGAKPGDGKDDTPGIRAAIDYCKKSGSKKLILPAGTYDFWADRAKEEYLYISNNDQGLQRIAFALFNMNGLEIDGQGSMLIFHGYICPFVIQESSSVTLKNFSIDYTRTFHSEGTIDSVYKDSMDVSFSNQYPFKIQNERLIFTGENNNVFPYAHLLEFDAVKKETAFMASDYWTGADMRVKDISEQKVRLYVHDIKGAAGNIMVFGVAKRLCPAVTITGSRQTQLCNINIYHCGSMGIIAQRSADVSLKKINVTPSPGSGRIISVPADATHFVNCSNSIIMDSCVFQNQMDDATNIHGIYAKISRVISPVEIEVQLIHYMQFGFNLFNAGDSVEFVHPQSLTTFTQGKIKTVEKLNNEYIILHFEEPVNGISVNDAAGNISTNPVVKITNSYIGNNRARGLLLGSKNKILIEKNTFHTPGAAILFEGDASFWYEQAGVKNVTIRNNIFDNCNYGIWGVAAIQVGSAIQANQRDSSRYNQNIAVTGNVFKIFDPRLINIYSVNKFSFTNNTIIKSGSYLNQFPQARSFEVKSCSDVTIKNNGGVQDNAVNNK